MESFSWPQVLAWRMRRQLLDLPADLSADDSVAEIPAGANPVVAVARRLAGVQAQVMSAAALAVAVRRPCPPGALGRALWSERSLLKTWAMRGTLHLLPAEHAGAYLALAATVRNWEKPSWQRAFGATPADLDAIGGAATEALAGGDLMTREELVEEIVGRTGSQHLAETLGSSWGTLFKPLAWWGVLCQGPPRDGRPTFTAPARWVPGWTGLPAVEDAARTVLLAFLGAHGPADPELFDAWLMRGMSRKAVVRGWFAALEDELTTVEVEGRRMWMPTEQVGEVASIPPAGIPAIRLLGGFDPYILGAGTGSAPVVPAAHRAEVSRKAGWISPVVLNGGRVAGVWQVGASGAVPEVRLFEELPGEPLAAEVERVAGLLASFGS